MTATSSLQIWLLVWKFGSSDKGGGGFMACAHCGRSVHRCWSGSQVACSRVAWLAWLAEVAFGKMFSQHLFPRAT